MNTVERAYGVHIELLNRFPLMCAHHKALIWPDARMRAIRKSVRQARHAICVVNIWLHWFDSNCEWLAAEGMVSFCQLVVSVDVSDLFENGNKCKKRKNRLAQSHEHSILHIRFTTNILAIVHFVVALIFADGNILPYAMVISDSRPSSQVNICLRCPWSSGS